ncbi:hypothetical protein JOL79_21430 [Microbispora sp. RL4-1S]|uniref:Secreted protein n=1 Tax=Microbispora oryzae TaxID=2806554 RepID=A0A941AJI3_9ACTN|nr:hypothetical protein [Microbispora oryzae]MBP2706375.1 hypothetical protein [Microbispora oryzae]
MTTPRALTAISLAAGILALAPATAHAATTSAGSAASAASSATVAQAPHAQWGTYYAPGRRAKALGSLRATPKDDPSAPASLVAVTGSVTDRTVSRSTCGWAVFRVSIAAPNGKVVLKQHNYRTCSYGTPLKFAFADKNVYEVELKVCAEAKASKPSLNCLYAGTWKPLYVYYEG